MLLRRSLCQSDGISCKGRIEAACACVQEAVILKASLRPLRRLSCLRLDLLYHQKSLPETKDDIQMRQKFLECILFGLGQDERLVSLEIIASDAAVFLNRYPAPLSLGWTSLSLTPFLLSFCSYRTCSWATLATQLCLICPAPSDISTRCESFKLSLHELQTAEWSPSMFGTIQLLIFLICSEYDCHLYGIQMLSFSKQSEVKGSVNPTGAASTTSIGSNENAWTYLWLACLEPGIEYFKNSCCSRFARAWFQESSNWQWSPQTCISVFHA